MKEKATFSHEQDCGTFCPIQMEKEGVQQMKGSRAGGPVFHGAEAGPESDRQMSETGEDGKNQKKGITAAISSHNNVFLFATTLIKIRHHDGNHKHMDEVQRGQNNKQPVVLL